MLFSPEEATHLKNYLSNLVGTESDADPQVLAEFMYALLQASSPHDVLLDRCIEELSVFLEEKTEDIVRRVFSALDDKSYLPKESQGSTNVNNSATTTTTTTTTTEPVTSKPVPAATQKRSYHEDEDEDNDDEDDDTNFKRRNNKPSSTVESSENSRPALKRSFSTDDGSDNGPLQKQSRQDASNGQDSILNGPLRQRLGDRKFRKPCFDYDRKGYCMRGDFCPYDHGQDHLVMETNGNGMVEPLDNNVSTRDGTPGHGGGGPMRIKGRGGGVINRSGPGGGRGNRRQQEEVPYTSRYTPYSTKIVVENIPQERCTIDSVTEFFGKFGKLVNLSVQSDASRAFLQYTSHQEAMAAYQSPAVIFNNRFVKVFWRKVDEEEERKEYLAQQRLASLPDPEAIKAKAEQLAKEREERQKKHQEHLQKVLQFQKQKQQLIERQIEEHKSLVEKLQHTPPKSKERESIMQAITNLSASIKSNQVSTTAPTLTTPPPPPTSTTVPTTTTSATSVTSPSKASSSASPPSAPIAQSTTPTTTTPLDAKKAEMERLKAKLASLEAAKSSGYPSYRGGRGGMNTWSARGARSFSLDNRNKATPGSLTTQIPTTTENQENGTKQSSEDAANKETTD